MPERRLPAARHAMPTWSSLSTPTRSATAPAGTSMRTRATPKDVPSNPAEATLIPSAFITSGSKGAKTPCPKFRRKNMARNQDQLAKARRKTRVQILDRLHPGRPPAPGRPQRIEAHYRRHGTSVISAGLDVRSCSTTSRSTLCPVVDVPIGAGYAIKSSDLTVLADLDARKVNHLLIDISRSHALAINRGFRTSDRSQAGSTYGPNLIAH